MIQPIVSPTNFGSLAPTGGASDATTLRLAARAALSPTVYRSGSAQKSGTFERSWSCGTSDPVTGAPYSDRRSIAGGGSAVPQDVQCHEATTQNFC
jgi:hypothetical protein